MATTPGPATSPAAIPTRPAASPSANLAGAFAGVRPGEVQGMLDNLADYGMVAPSDMMRLQRAANADIDTRKRESSLDSLTFQGAVVDAHSALVGIMSDLTTGSDRKSLKDIFVYENRLRGLGFLLIGLGLCGMVADLVASA